MRTILTVYNSYCGSNYQEEGTYQRRVNAPSNQKELIDLVDSIDADHLSSWNHNASIQFQIHTETKGCKYRLGSGHMSPNSISAHCCLPNWWVKNKNIILSYTKN